MITLGKMIYKLTGYMTKKELVRNARAVGKQACTRMQETGRNLSHTEINEILSGVIGKKGATKIEISGDKASLVKASLVKAYMENFGAPKVDAEYVANRCLSAALAKGKGNKTHLNLQLGKMPALKSVNIIPHETEHALHRTFSFDILLTKLFGKTSIGRKYIQRAEENCRILNRKNIVLQENLIEGLTGWRDAAGGIASEATRAGALLEITKCTDKQMLRKKIKELLYEKDVLEIGNDKQNNFVLKEIIGGLKDESRAYNTGASVEKLYRQGLRDGSHIATTKSEVIADICDEAVQVMKKERIHIQKNRLREFFGLKANRSKEQEIIRLAQERNSRMADPTEILAAYKYKILSSEDCTRALKKTGLSSEWIEETMKRISLEA